MLLTPHCRHSVSDDLGCENTFHSLVKGLLHFVFSRPIAKIAAERLNAEADVAQQHHSVDHRIIIVGDMRLIVTLHGPELRPTPVFILSGKKIIHSGAEAGAVSHIASGLIETGEIDHLGCGRVIVGGRIVAALLVGKHGGFFLLSHRSDHVDVLGPSAGHTLPEQHLITDAPGLV